MKKLTRSFKSAKWMFFSLVIIACFVALSFHSSAVVFSENIGSTVEYELVWSDEFNYNGKLDSTKWHHQTLFPNGTSWFNDEKQAYTDRIENSYVKNGSLFIVAKKEQFTTQGTIKNYTSARLNSKFSFEYGRVEVLAKLPAGNGVWSAIWTLGQTIKERGGYWAEKYGKESWPYCGEIDIMEHWGENQNIIQAALHNPASYGNTVNKKAIEADNLYDEFHLYAIEWDKNKIDFFFDDTLYFTYQPTKKNKKTWPYSKPHYLLLNVAMGGAGGEIDSDFSQTIMEIDYVRVYQQTDK